MKKTLKAFFEYWNCTYCNCWNNESDNKTICARCGEKREN